jgi:hypothetical protein
MSSGVFGDKTQPQSVALDGKDFLAVGIDDGAGAAWSSPGDLSSFATVEDPGAVTTEGLVLKGVAARDGQAVASGWTTEGGAHQAAIITRADAGSGWEQAKTDVDKSVLTEVGATAGDGQGWVAVGASSPVAMQDVAGAKPLVLFSDDGRTWSSVAPPLPAGWIGGGMVAVTATGPGTAFPGYVAVGAGVRNDPTTGSTTRGGIVWHSSDHGRTWQIVSDENFIDDGRGVSSDAVAADKSTIFVGGWADKLGASPGANGVIDQPGEYWHITAADGGHWKRNADDLPAGRSSRVTAMTALPGGGVAVATQLRDSDGKGEPDTGAEANPEMQLTTTTDGETYTDLTQFEAREVTSMVSDGKVVVFVGTNAQGAGDSWYTEL